MVTCRETVGDCGRSLSQTSYFSEDRRCSRLPTDTTVKSETERGDTLSVSITKRAPLSFQSVRPTGPVVSVLDGDTIEVLHNNHAERIRLNRTASRLKSSVYRRRIPVDMITSNFTILPLMGVSVKSGEGQFLV